MYLPEESTKEANLSSLEYFENRDQNGIKQILKRLKKGYMTRGVERGLFYCLPWAAVLVTIR